MDFLNELQDSASSNPAAPILIVIKGRYPFATDLRGLDLSDCISILLLNSAFADKMPPTHLPHFDFVHQLDIGEFWSQSGALSQLDALQFPQLEQSIDDIIRCLKQDDSFDIERLRLVVLEKHFIRSAARIRSRYNIPGARPEDINRFTDRVRMKDTARDGGIATPDYIIVSPSDLKQNSIRKTKLEEIVGYPMMLKPFYGLRVTGIEKIDSPTKLDAWINNHPQPDKQYIAEEYVDVPEYHLIALVQASGVQMFPAPYYSYGNSMWTSICHGVPLCTTIETDPKKRGIVEKFVRRTIDVFDPPKGGLVYVQAFMTPEGKMKLNEVSYRAPAFIGSLTFTENSNISPESVQIMAQLRQLDLDQLAEIGARRSTYYSNVAYPKQEGIVKRLVPLPEHMLSSDVEVTYAVKAGTRTHGATNVTNVGDMAVRISLWNNDAESMKRDLNWLRENYHPVTMED